MKVCDADAKDCTAESKIHLVSGIPAEMVVCPSCDRDDWTLYAVYEDKDYGVPGRWKLVCCRSCGMVYLNPRPIRQAFDQIYPERYVPAQMELRSNSRWMMKHAIWAAYEGAKVKILDGVALPPKPRILDVGCGAGYFLELLRRRGWSPTGVEPNPRTAARARGEFNLDVREGTLATAKLEPTSFDVVTLWHSLEHDPTPKQTLASCWKVLKPGGVAIVQVPDQNSWEAKTLQNYFWGADIPRHFQFFTAETLSSMARSQGFQIARVQRTRNPTSWLWSLLRYLKWDLYAQMERNIGVISALYTLIAPLYYLFSRGDWLTAVLERPTPSQDRFPIEK